MDGEVDPATLTWAAKFSNVPAADPGAAEDPNAGQTSAEEPSTGQAPAGDPPTAPQPPDPPASQPQGDPSGPLVAPVAASATGGDPGAAPDPNQAPLAGQNDPPATGTDAPKKINVTIKTSYGQTVRYWIQDRATDANNEAPEGSGTVLINGDDHGPGESIGLSCIETANGASICYQRESNPNPPGGGMTPWSSVLISDGGTFTIQETAQPLGDPPPPGDATAGQTPPGDPPATPALGDPSTQLAPPVAASAPTGADPGGDPAAAPDPNQAPPAGQGDPPATNTDAPKKINVTIKTSYGQTVRYWIQDRATDANNEAPEGSGTVLIDGDDHGPGESIGLSCIETANGASICYQRESNPNPPGGGVTPWSSVLISDGGTFTIQETAQPLGGAAPATDPGSGQTTTGDPISGQAPAGDAASGPAPADPSPLLAAPVTTAANTGADPGADGDANQTGASGPSDPPGAATPADFETLRPQCDDWLSKHKLKAEDAEVVSGDMQCFFYLDDHIVTIEDVHDALVAAFPVLSGMDGDVWPWLRSRWDLERTQALTFAGKMPVQGSLVRPSPSGAPPKDGLLVRAADGQTYWEPAPVQTWGESTLVPAPQGWIKDFFDFYRLAAPADAAALDACAFNGADDTLDNVVAVLSMQAALAGYAISSGGARGMAAAIVESQRAAGATGKQVGDRDPVAPPPADPGAPQNKGRQWGATVANQTAGHWKLTSSGKVVDNVVQWQFSLTDVQHPDNKTGPEGQGSVQISFNMKTGDLQIQPGLAGTCVLQVWEKVKIQLQITGGVSGGASKSLVASGSISGVFQVQGGPQVAVTLGPVQMSLGPVAGLTFSKDAPTVDAGGVLQGQYQWDKDPPPKAAPAAAPEIDIHELAAMSMTDLLIALDRIASDGHLEKVASASHDDRVEVAIEAVKRVFMDADKQKTDAFYAFVGTLSEQDQTAIRKYVADAV